MYVHVHLEQLSVNGTLHVHVIVLDSYLHIHVPVTHVACSVAKLSNADLAANTVTVITLQLLMDTLWGGRVYYQEYIIGSYSMTLVHCTLLLVLPSVVIIMAFPG